jgi:hypothetical protein
MDSMDSREHGASNEVLFGPNAEFFSRSRRQLSVRDIPGHTKLKMRRQVKQSTICFQ